MKSQDYDEDRLWSNSRFYQYEGTSLRKNIIIEYSDMPSEQIQANIPYNSETRELDLGLVLHHHLIEIMPPGYKYQVFYYSNDSEYFTFGGMYPFEQLLLLDEEFAAYNYLFVKLHRIHPPVIIGELQRTKKKRKNDRTVKQMLEKVSQWRKIQQNEGITFEEAAKIVEVPKKTLDDYFRQIKQGQTYGFDFQENLNRKIGVLRKFVRENHKKQSNGENQIKILEQFMNKSANSMEDLEDEDQYQEEQYQSGEQ